MKKYIRAILTLSSVGMLFYIIYNQRDQIKELKSAQVRVEKDLHKVDSLKKVIDSLDAEVFRLNIDVTRYGVALDRMGEIYPEAKKEFDYILSHETE